jgi:hypothetical protein
MAAVTQSVRTQKFTFSLGGNSSESPLGGDFCTKLRAHHLGMSLGPFVCVANNGYVCSRQGRRRPSPRFQAAGEVIYFALVKIHGQNSNSVCYQQSRRRPTPRLCATGASGVTKVQSQSCISGGAPAAKLRLTTPARRFYIVARANLPLFR